VTAELEGKTALVAGAGPGVGRACAEALGRAGANVVVAARHATRLAELADEVARATGRPVQPVAADIAELGSPQRLVDAAVDRFGTLDVLVNVATSGGEHGRIGDADWSAWRQAFEVNVIAIMELSRLAGRAMAATGGGSIIQIGTVGTHSLPAGRACYTATKAAMVAASLTLAKELGPSNVRVNVVTPGFISGGPLDALLEGMAQRAESSVEDASRRLAASAALGRHVDPADVAAAVLFLAGPGARNVTGVELPVTAGR
jgi:NAD(P)-dependent dehydrogenase (short-subunit alcohol dehydrogenase family)